MFRSTSLFFRTNFMAPMMLHAFFILDFISVSSFKSLDMMLPRYLKSWTKWMKLVLLLSSMSGRRFFHFVLFLRFFERSWEVHGDGFRFFCGSSDMHFQAKFCLVGEEGLSKGFEAF